MAVIILNPLVDSVNGRDGSIVWYKRRGTQCFRAFVMPYNPNSALQKINRGLFRQAVEGWQGLTTAEKTEFSRQAKRRKPGLFKRMSAYNIYISEFMNKAASDRVKRALSNAGKRLPAGFLGLRGYKYALSHYRFPSVSASHMLHYDPPSPQRGHWINPLTPGRGTG